MRVHHPLQQGLRRFRGMLYAYNNLGVSASSITTRIKTTEDMSAVLSTAVSASASSITTRIKT